MTEPRPAQEPQPAPRGQGPSEWLPGWEEIERRVTEGRSGAERPVSAVRARIDSVRMSLLEAFADSCLAGGQPDRAIPYLEQAATVVRSA